VLNTWHLNYSELVKHEQSFGAKRLILTHMSRDMLVHAAEVPQAHPTLIAWEPQFTDDMSRLKTLWHVL
jgi:hypothetical protein